MTLSAGPSRWQLFLTLFLALNFFFLLTSSGRVRTIDEVTVDYQAESLATRGSTSVPQAVSTGLFYGKMDRAGRPQAPYGIGQAVLVLPWYAAGRALRAVLPGIPPGARDTVLDAALTASSATFSALAAALAFLILVRLGIATRPALASALILALATPLFAYSSWFFSEPLVAALFLAAALCLFTGEKHVPISTRQALAGGVLLGIALWVRPTHVLAAFIFLAAMLVRDRGKVIRPVIVLACVVAAFGGAYLLRNQFLFGNPFDFGYPEVAEGGKRLNSFETPLLTGLRGFLFSPGKSVFLFAPPILLAIAGIRRLAERDRGLATCAAGLPLAYLFFFARYTQWEGGYSVGPRYLVPAISVLCLGLGPMLQAAGPVVRRVALVLFLMGFVVQGIGMATSFLEDQANGTYYDEHFNYRMSYAPLISQTSLALFYAESKAPAPIGRGFDRWFVFLRKAGVARGTILGLLVFELAGLVFFTWQLEGILAKLRIAESGGNLVARQGSQ